MRADPDIEKILYRIIDGLRATGRTFHRVEVLWGDHAEIEVRPFTQTRIIRDGKLVGTDGVLARLEGQFSRQNFAAYLQIRRSQEDHRDIEEISWQVQNAEILLKWAVFARLNDAISISEGHIRRPVSEAHQYLWASTLTNVIPTDATAAMVAFTLWAEQNIPEQVMPVYFGKDQVPAETSEQFDLEGSRDVWCVLALTNLSTEDWAGTLYGSVHRLEAKHRYLTTGCDLFVALNYYVLGEVRRRGIEVQAIYDDECLGSKPITDDILPLLEQSQNALREWLMDKLGGSERLRNWLDRINWSDCPAVEFCTGFDGELDDPDRRPTEVIPSPDIRWFLPYP